MNIIVHGSRGKLGTAICRLAEQNGHTIAAGVDAAAGASSTFPVFAAISDCDMPADVIIDCSAAAAVPAAAAYAASRKVPLVVCTTGLSEADAARVKAAAQEIPVFMSANMSVGINLLSRLVEQAARALAGFDVEIIEKHHNRKADAPSGTALLLASRVNAARGGDMSYALGHTDKREAGEIGIHALRGGNIIGEHTVVFAGEDEVLEFSHAAASKDVFAAGALRAAGFVVGKAAGLYDMNDLLGRG